MNARKGWPTGAIVPLALLSGSVQLAVWFSDAPASEPARLLIAALAAVAGGFALGSMRPSAWFWGGVTASWGNIVMGAMFASMGLPRGWAVLVLPTALGLAGSWSGARWARRR
jgi:hypothetical protein